MRQVTATYLRAALAQQTDEVLLVKIEISHPQILEGPLRLVANLQDLVAKGHTYTAFPFEITLPEDGEKAVPSIRLIIDNVDQQILAAIRKLPPSPPPTVMVSLCLASQPDIDETSYDELSLREVPYSMFRIEGILTIDEDDLEPYPRYEFTPALFPGMF